MTKRKAQPGPSEAEIRRDDLERAMQSIQATLQKTTLTPKQRVERALGIASMYADSIEDPTAAITVTNVGKRIVENIRSHSGPINVRMSGGHDADGID